jgi:adenylate kinase
VLLQRLSGRWVCRGAEEHTYHLLFHPPRVPGKCDVDGTELYQRDDDKAEVQAHRIQVFLKKTAPLIEYYTARKLLVEIDGEQPIPAVTQALRSAIEATMG